MFFVKFNYVICVFIKVNIHRFFFSLVIIYVMSHFQGKVAIRLFDTVKSSPKKSNAVRSLRDLYLFLSSKTPSVYSVLNPPKTSKQSPSFHFSQDRRSLNISPNPNHFPLISKLLNGKSPSIFIPTFHFHSINLQILP